MSNIEKPELLYDERNPKHKDLGSVGEEVLCVLAT